MIAAPQNPNSSKNRVPHGDEIVALRSLVQSEANVLQTLEDSIKRAKATQADAEIRLETAKRELEAAMSALAAAHESVATLETLREPLQRSMNTKLGILHPIRRLPTELLVEIFQYRVEEDEAARRLDADLDGNWGLCDAPLTLSAVCSRWREIVLSQPCLWRFFNLTASHFAPQYQLNQAVNPLNARLKHWIVHSQDRKVSVAIRGIGDAFDTDGTKSGPLIRKVLAGFGPRLERLHLLFTGCMAFDQVLGPPTTYELPELLHLHVHVSDHVAPNVALFPTRAFAKSKKLITLSLRNAWWDKDLSLPNLTIFDVYNPDWNISPHQLFHVIAHCPELKHMPIEFEYKSSLQPIMNHVTLPKLEELQTTCEWITRAGPSLKAGLALPALVKLQLYGTGDVDVLASFIRDVAPRLQYLHLGLSPPQSQESELNLLPLFHAAANIGELELDSVAVQSSIFDEMARSSAAPESGEGVCLLPNLTSLIVKNATLADADALLRFVASRTKEQGEKKAFPRRLRNVLLVGENNIGAWHEAQIVTMLEGSRSSPKLEENA